MNSTLISRSQGALAARWFWRLAGLALLSAAVASAKTKSATLVTNCQSIGLDNFSGTIPGVEPAINYVTSYDGRSDRKPLTQDLGGGHFYISQELRPRAGQPGVYEADYLSYTTSGNLNEYGSFTINLPTADTDTNGLPDFAQKDKSGSSIVTGNIQKDWPSSYGIPFSAQLSRSSGSASGSYSLTLNGPAGTIHYAGSLDLLHVWGSVTYTRGSPNLIFFNLNRTDQRGATTTLTGSGTFNVDSPDQLTLPQYFLTGNDNKTYVVKPSTLSRKGSRYVGPVQLADGTLETSWPDYVNWVLEITDENDSDGNGVPDLSDLGYQPPSIVRQPQGQGVLVSETVTLDVLATAMPPPTFHSEGGAAAVQSIAFSPDGKRLLGAGGGHIDFWRVSDGALLYRYDLPWFIHRIAVSPTGKYFGFEGKVIGVARMPRESGIPPSLSFPQRLPDGSFRMVVTGDPFDSIEVQATTDMRTWATFTNVVTTNATMPIVDPDAAKYPFRFYRAVGK